jgi:hypothetical protein
MIEFTQATKEDVLGVYPQAAQCEAESLQYGREVFEKDLIALEDRAVAVRDGERCIGAYGIVEMWPGVARAWALFSESLLKEHATLLSLHVRRDLLRMDRYNRIEATTGKEHFAGCRFLRWLGFQREGLMRRYTPAGNDTYLYAKVRDV